MKELTRGKEVYKMLMKNTIDIYMDLVDTLGAHVPWPSNLPKYAQTRRYGMTKEFFKNKRCWCLKLSRDEC